jgi:hypothetical protein
MIIASLAARGRRTSGSGGRTGSPTHSRRSTECGRAQSADGQQAPHRRSWMRRWRSGTGSRGRSAGPFPRTPWHATIHSAVALCDRRGARVVVDRDVYASDAGRLGRPGLHARQRQPRASWPRPIPWHWTLPGWESEARCSGPRSRSRRRSRAARIRLHQTANSDTDRSEVKTRPDWHRPSSRVGCQLPAAPAPVDHAVIRLVRPGPSPARPGCPGAGRRAGVRGGTHRGPRGPPALVVARIRSDRPVGLLSSTLRPPPRLVFAHDIPGGMELATDHSKSYAEWLAVFAGSQCRPRVRLPAAMRNHEPQRL